jgi:hypothetical protein
VHLSRKVIAYLPLLAALASAQEPGPLASIADLRTAVSKRISSYNRQGGYEDAAPIRAGQTFTLAEIAGAGSVRHIWMTINSPAKYHLRELVLRMYWDGETEPSVEVPVGDFFGNGFGRYKTWQSMPITVQGKALNCYWPMPFARGARITVTNEGPQDVRYFFYQVDYEAYRDTAGVEAKGRFHAQWRRENPTRGVPVEVSKRINVTGKDNYVFADVTGKGQFVGLILNVQGFATGWWGEGDDMFFVDGESFPPSLHGTGLEDYFGSAWGFDDEFNYPFTGYSRKGNNDGTGMHTMYRFHITDPIHFTKSLRATIEHGHANSRSDDFSSVAFWYQTEPHRKFEPLLPVDARMPNDYWKIELLKSHVPD